MTFHDRVNTAAKATVGCASWIHGFNVLIIIVAVVASPFTLFTSLLALLAVPFNAAAARIVENTHQQKELTKLHLLLLADLHYTE